MLPATAEPPRADPVIVLQGGPGQAATALGSFYGGPSWAAVRRERAIVLLDQRGTGGSAPLDCFLGGDDANTKGYLDDLLPVPAVRACAAELREAAELARYTTHEIARDVEAVREALGADRLNLYGTSYGTRVALAYLRLHPDRVRSMVLKGVLPPDVAMPAEFAPDVERSLRMLSDQCRADSLCARLTPDLLAAVDSLLRAVDRPATPIFIMTDTAARRGSTIAPSRGTVGLLLRSMLLSPTGAARIPALVRTALDGDRATLARAVYDQQQSTARGIFEGMRLSVMCAEDAPRIRREDAERRAVATALGTYWLDQVAAACAAWPVPPEPPARLDPPAGLPTPILLISGERDPATPPSYGDRVARRFPNARHVVVRNASHSFALMQGCVDRLIAAFYSAGSTAGLDAGCAERVVAPPFAASYP